MKLSRILAATALAGVIATPAFAGATLKSVMNTGSKGKLKVTAGGQINQAFIVVGDGESVEPGFVMNDASSTRFFFKFDGKFGNGFKAGGKLEAEFEYNASDKWENDDKLVGSNSNGDFFNLRYADIYIKYNDTVKLSIGQGDTATNKTLESDLSGTKNVAYANVDAFLEEKEVVIKGIGPVAEIEDFLFAEDGQSRQMRARLDVYLGESGFKLSASTGQTSSNDGRDDPLFYDIAVSYKGKFGDTKVKAAAGHVFNFENDEDVSVTDISASVLFGNGFNVTGAWERVHYDMAGVEDSDLFFVKLGYQTDAICDWGTSALAVSYARGDGREGADDREGNDIAIAFAQDIDAVGAEWYLGYHHYWFDFPGVDIESINAGITGVKIKF